MSYEVVYYQKGQEQDTVIAHDLIFITSPFNNTFALFHLYLWKIHWEADSRKCCLERLTPQVKLTLPEVDNSSGNSSLCAGVMVYSVHLNAFLQGEMRPMSDCCTIKTNNYFSASCRLVARGHLHRESSSVCMRTSTAKLRAYPRVGIRRRGSGSSPSNNLVL